MKYKAAVDIGGTKITASLSNKDGMVVKIRQPVTLKGNNKTIPRQVDKLIDYACNRIGIQKDEIDALGVSTCSPFKRKGKYREIITPNLCGGRGREDIPNDWKEIPLEKELSKDYKGKRLEIENDCVSAAIAERLFGAAKGEDNFVYVTWSTGIGTGAYVDGRLIRGKNDNAPHGGHIYIAEKGSHPCGCGNFGDLESLVSGSAIARDYGLKPDKTEEVFSAYKSGDKKAIKIIERAAKNFARGLASLNAVLDTRLFVIGGSVFMKNIDILLPMVKEEFFKSFPALSEGVEFKPSGLGEYLGDMAALSLVMPKKWIAKWRKKEPWESAPAVVELPAIIELD